VISRIRAFGEVAKALRGLRLADGNLPEKGAKLFVADKDVGYVTSATHSPALQANVALGYVRKEHNAIGSEVMVQVGAERIPAQIVALPFVPEAMPA
jgi:glycine cleavage system aminomethyltransferase T